MTNKFLLYIGYVKAESWFLASKYWGYGMYSQTKHISCDTE